MQYFSKNYNVRIYVKKIKNTFDQMDMYSFSFLSFDKYVFVSFQTQTNHRICTKVKNISSAFRIKFSNDRFVPPMQNVFAKPITSGGSEPSSLKNLAQCNTSFLPQSHLTYTLPNPQTQTPQPEVIIVVDELHK
jgi:hypothetical protein